MKSRRAFVGMLGSGGLIASVAKPAGYVRVNPEITSHLETEYQAVWVRGEIRNDARIPITVAITIDWLTNDGDVFGTNHADFQCESNHTQPWGVRTNPMASYHNPSALAETIDGYNIHTKIKR